MEVGDLVAGGGHQFDQDGRAETAIDGDAFAIEPVYEGDEVGGRANLDGFDEVAVADPIPDQGELAESGVEQVRGDIADFPGGGDGLEIPFDGGEGTQESDQRFVYLTEKGSAEDRIEGVEVLGH